MIRMIDKNELEAYLSQQLDDSFLKGLVYDMASSKAHNQEKRMEFEESMGEQAGRIKLTRDLANHFGLDEIEKEIKKWLTLDKNS